jgi:hypothetical protein
MLGALVWLLQELIMFSLGSLSIVFFPILYLPFFTLGWIRKGKTLGFILKVVYIIPVSGIHLAVFWMMGKEEASRLVLEKKLMPALLYSSAYWLALIFAITKVALMLGHGQAQF